MILKKNYFFNILYLILNKNKTFNDSKNRRYTAKKKEWKEIKPSKKD